MPALILALALLLTACAPELPATAIPATATPHTVALPSPTGTPTETPTAIPPSPTPYPAGCPETRGQIELTRFDTSLQAAPLQVRVYTPPCYSAQGGPYPFLVILHGQGYGDDQWDRLGIDAQADARITSGQAPPFLIFMPLEADTFSEPEQSSYDVLIADELLPWIERAYPACADRGCRALGGLSRGASWALRVGLLHPHLFGAVGAHSLSPFLNEVYRLPYWMMHTAAADLPRFYLDIGADDDAFQYALQFKDGMEAQGIALEWTVNPGSHDEAYWQARMGDYLDWYTQSFR